MMYRITGGPAAAEAYRSSHSLKDQELIVSLWGVCGVTCTLSGLALGTNSDLSWKYFFYTVFLIIVRRLLFYFL